MDNEVDIKENYLNKLDANLLIILLKDQSSKKNIIWATDNYSNRGEGYQFYDHISLSSITGRNGMVIKPRVEKSIQEQQTRIREKAEVFTPSWICNCQNNLVDKEWFGRSDIFNKEVEKSWQVIDKKIEFTNGKTWQDYVSEKRIEITCGEAPYLVSRYDTVSGNAIPVKERIGLLDRKMRIICENTINEEEWNQWTIIAYKNIFGFEWQGDNLLLARENLLLTYIDYYEYMFNKSPGIDNLERIAEIISWNIWQMDGLKFVIPNSCIKLPSKQLSFFEEDNNKKNECIGCLKNKHDKHTGIYCKIMNWDTNRPVKFVNTIKGR